MRFKRAFTAIGIVAVATLALTACNSGTPGGDTSEGGSTNTQTPWTVAEGVNLEGSPTFANIDKRGKVIIGVKEDQPNLG